VKDSTRVTRDPRSDSGVVYYWLRCIPDTVWKMVRVLKTREKSGRSHT
jgi:hypothetical protein